MMVGRRRRHRDEDVDRQLAEALAELWVVVNQARRITAEGQRQQEGNN